VPAADPKLGRLREIDASWGVPEMRVPWVARADTAIRRAFFIRVVSHIAGASSFETG